MTNDVNGANGSGQQHYLLFVWGNVEPELRGPYATDEERLEAARAIADAPQGNEHGIFRLDATGSVEVTSFSGDARLLVVSVDCPQLAKIECYGAGLGRCPSCYDASGFFDTSPADDEFLVLGSGAKTLHRQQ